MHQKEVVRENIQGRLLALLPPSRAGSRKPDHQQFRAGHLQPHAHSGGPGGPGLNIHRKIGLLLLVFPLDHQPFSESSCTLQSDTVAFNHKLVKRVNTYISHTLSC